jgi:hypothetical protein
MKRVSDNNEEQPDFPLRFGENVLVCVAGMPDFPQAFKDCWVEAILTGGEDAQGRFGVTIKDTEYLIERDRIQKKDTSVRPCAAGQNVLVYRHTSDGVHWKQAVVKSFLSYDMTDTDAIRSCEVYSHVYGKAVVFQYPVNICILGRHYEEPPKVNEKKKIKTLA